MGRVKCGHCQGRGVARHKCCAEPYGGHGWSGGNDHKCCCCKGVGSVPDE